MNQNDECNICMKYQSLFMKRVLVIISLIVISFRVSVEAQEIKYGFMAGLCLPSISLRNSSINDGYQASTSSDIAYHINGFVSLRSDGWWGISIEPGYKESGGILNFDYNIAPHQFSYRVTKKYSMVELPILWNVYLKHKLNISSGLGFDYIVKTTNDQFWQTMNSSYSVGTILPDVENKFNCSAIFGIGYNLSENLDISARYELGLTRLMRVELVDAMNYPYNHPVALNSFYINCLQVSLKYKMN